MSLPSFSPYHPSALTAKRAVATDQLEIELAAPDGALAEFVRAGQFCRVRVQVDGDAPHEGIFAMMSAPGEGLLRFLIRTPSPEGGEAADCIAQLAVGSPLEITMPAGEGFALDRARGKDLYFVATGTAIAPVRSAIEQVLKARDAYGSIALDHGLRSPLHLAIPTEVRRWRAAGIEVRIHYSEPRADGTIVGVKVQDAVLDHIRDFRESALIAVGHSAMVDEIRAAFAARGGDPALVLHNY
jgi:ferredoxin-NADP reductase